MPLEFPEELIAHTLIYIAIGVFLLFYCSENRVTRVIACLSILLAGLISVAYFTFDALTGRGFDESVLYHLGQNIQGAGLGDFSALATLVLIALVAIATLSLAVFVRAKSSRIVPSLAASFLLLSSLAIHPLITDLQMATGYQVATPLVLDGSSEFSKLYAQPGSDWSISKKRNLVYIYAESLERTYFDKDIFGDVVPNLRRRMANARDYTNIKQARGTGWTIGGMVASQCGIPLVTTGSNGNSLSGVADFLPGAVCLGDILNRSGYDLTFIGGADLAFAGKGNFYRSHGFHSVFGRDELIDALPNRPAQSNWGLYDDTVLPFVATEYRRKIEQGRPFAIFALTLDTHHPAGYPSPTCKSLLGDENDNSILKAVRCTDYLIDSLLKDIEMSGHANDTIVVVASDHLAMPNTATSLLDKGERTNLFLLFDPTEEPSQIHRLGTALDIAPTLLESLGLTTTEFGLGRNLNDTASLAEHIPNFANVGIWDHVEEIRKFWLMPDLRSGLDIDIQARVLTIGQFEYPIPIRLGMDQSRISRLYFQEATGPHPVSFGSVDQPSIHVDRCSHFSPPGKPRVQQNRYCAVIQQANSLDGMARPISMGGNTITELEIASVLSGTPPTSYTPVRASSLGVVVATGKSQAPAGYFAESTRWFNQGLNLLGVREGHVEYIKNINPCSWGDSSPPDNAYLTPILGQHRKDFDFVIVASNSTTWCERKSNNVIFRDSGIKPSGDRYPLLAVFDSEGKLVKTPIADRENYVALYIDDLYTPPP